MAEVEGQAEGKTQIADWNARDLERKFNGELVLGSDSMEMLHFAPKYKVYIYNVGPMEWIGTNAIAKGSAGNFPIAACPKGEPYVVAVILPAVCIDSYFIEQEMKTHLMSGENLAQDIVRPMIGKNWSFGQNLDEFGVFWTRNNPPTELELAKARGLMEKTFRKMLEHATRLETTGRLADITPLMRLAADYFEEDRGWNRIYRKAEQCFACKQPIQAGAIIHTCGAVQPGKWLEAIAAGLKTRQQAEDAGIELPKGPVKPAPARKSTN
jgi:hypothetical protein